ncbi:MAG: DUF4176 domain-containing protein [Ruminococcaceae bacterium]|nr:DUF4176 domain-containing protein [Oscillospiraceae bacterium]
MKQLLPLGSVVLLNGGKKRVMICGRMQIRVQDNVMFDYSACLYPEGIVDPKKLYLFNNEDIDKVYFVGMQDVEEFEFRARIEEEMNKRQENG